MFAEHGFDNPCYIISKYLGWELKAPLCLVLYIVVSQEFFLTFFYILIFHIVSVFEGTSLPGLVDRSIVEVLCVQLVADVLRHRLGADVDANQWCSPRQNLWLLLMLLSFFKAGGLGGQRQLYLALQSYNMEKMIEICFNVINENVKNLDYNNNDIGNNHFTYQDVWVANQSGCFYLACVWCLASQSYSQVFLVQQW